MANGLLIYGEIFAHFLICVLGKPFLIYDFAPDPIWVSLYLIWGNFFSSFYQCNSKHCSLENVLIGLYNVNLSLYYSVFPCSQKQKKFREISRFRVNEKVHFPFNPYHPRSFFNCFVMRPGRDDAIGRGWTCHWQIARPQQVTQPQGPGIHWRLVFSPFISAPPGGITYVIRVWSDLANLMPDVPGSLSTFLFLYYELMGIYGWFYSGWISINFIWVYYYPWTLP